MHSRFYRIGVGTIFVLIIAGFVLPGIVDVIIPKSQNKHLARIDGEPINEPHFYRLLTLSVQRLQMFYPKITFPELIQMNYPTDMLRDFVRRQIMRKHMEKEGFLVNEKSMIALLKKQLAGNLPESRSERRILVEDAKTAALLDQLILPYAFPQSYTKLQLQALSIQRQFNLVEIPYDHMVVTKTFSAEMQKDFEKTARKKHNAVLTTPKRKDVALMTVDPNKINVSAEEARQFFDKNKERYQDATFDAVSKQVAEHAQHEKISAMINDIKTQLDQEKETIDQLADQLKLTVTTYKQIDSHGENAQKQVLPAREKILEALSRLDEEEFSVVADDQKPGYFYAIKVLKVYPEHPKTGEELIAALKDLWTKEQQQDVARKLADEIIESKKELSGYIKKNHLPVHKNLSISASTQPEKYPVKDLNPDIVDRLLTAPKDELHMEYGRNSILLFDVIKDTAAKSDDQSFQKQKKGFEQMATEAAMQAWFNNALTHHKVDINVSALHQRLNA
ncbi:MAG: SurA N-terminal domain-containing protein [Pseudomonadota bacterium]